MQVLRSRSRENARRQAKQACKNSRPQAVYATVTSFGLRQGAYYLLRSAHPQGKQLDKDVMD